MPTFDAATTRTDLASSTSWSHTVGSGANRLLLVWVGTGSSGVTATGVTYGGVALTLLAASDAVSDFGASNERRVELWYLKAPASGAATVAVSLSATTGVTCAAVSLAAVAQGTTFGTVVKAGGDSRTSVSTAMSGATSDLVMSSVFFRNADDPSAGGSQTVRADTIFPTTNGRLAVTSQAGGSVTASFSWSTSTTAVQLSVPVKDDPGTIVSTSGTFARAARTIAVTATTGSTATSALTAARTARTFSTTPTMTGRTALTAARGARGFSVNGTSDLPTAAGRPDAATAIGWGRADREFLAVADAEDPIVPPPPGPARRRYRRSSYAVSPPTFADDGWSHPRQTRTLINRDEVGRHRFRLDGVDRSYFRGVPVLLLDDSHANPFGHETARLRFPQVSPFEKPGDGDIDWLHEGLGLRITLVSPISATDPDWTWSGYCHNLTPDFTEDGWGFIAEFKGFLYMTDDARNKPLPTARLGGALDIGERVASALNVTAHHYPAVRAVTTGITTRKRGSLGESSMDYIRELLADAWTDDGKQWTVLTAPTGQIATIQLPDPTHVDYTISLGQDGCDFSALNEDTDELPNVIYGTWVDPDGGRHNRLKWPRLHEDAAPPFPLTPGATFDPGDGTHGFQPFSDWMRRNGFAGFDSDDTYLASDADDVREVQQRMGVTIDGIVGGQTWGTAFNTGADVGSLDKAIYLPISWDPRVEPWLYAPDGTRLGPNPRYDVQIRRKEAWINFGEGLTYRDVRNSAKQMVLKAIHGIGLVGQITCTTDPEETSWLKAFAGKTLRVRYLYGSGSAGVTFHISRIARTYRDDGQVTTTLDVDTKWRDAYTVAQIIERNRASRVDPARAIRLRQASKLDQDTVLQFDADDVGRIGKHVVQGGFWRVVQFPAASWGTIARVVAQTSPATEFALMLFSRHITPRDLLRLVGNPLSISRPYNPQATALADAGFIQAWGSAPQPAGYSKTGAADGFKDPGNGEPPDPLTGRLEYDSSTEFASDNGATLYLAEWCTLSTNIWVRLYLAPVEF